MKGIIFLGFYGGIGVRYFGREVGQSGFALKARKELVTEVLGFGLAYLFSVSAFALPPRM